MMLNDLNLAGNELWSFVESTVTDLETSPFNELMPTKLGKAKLHTWLAWKKDPGKPFGQALKAGYFDINAPTVQPFLDWFSNTFELS